MVINDRPDMISVVYRGLEATNQTDTNFDAYRYVHNGTISVPDCNENRKIQSRFGIEFVKSDILIFCSRIIVTDTLILK